MSIAEITTEIDAYLFRLGQARDLLRDSETAAACPVAAPKRAKVRGAKRPSAADSAARIQQLQQQHKSEKQKAVPCWGTIDSVVTLEDSVPNNKAVIQAMPIKVKSSIKTDDQFPVGLNRTQNSAHRRRRPLQPAATANPPRSASPLESHAPFRVVVVSPEAAQKARDKAEPVVMRSFSMPASPESSRRAFEALFQS